MGLAESSLVTAFPFLPLPNSASLSGHSYILQELLCYGLQQMKFDQGFPPFLAPSCPSASRKELCSWKG